MSRRLLVTLVALGLLSAAGIAVGIAGSRHSTTSTAEPAAQRFEGAVLPLGVRAPDFTLRDQDGRPISMRQFRGSPVVVTFLYTRCKNTCPVEAQQIKGALDDLGRPVPALAVSVDPAHDTAASARHFNAEQGIGGRLLWALGPAPALRRLWKRFAVTGQSPKAEHMSVILLVDRHGFERVGFPPEQTTPERLAHDLAVLLREQA
jgi:protein SCO1/2